MTAPGTLNLGLIGCGNIAQWVHLPLWSRLPEGRLVAVAEADPERLEAALKAAPGSRGFQSYEEMLALPELPAVVIALPNALHAPVARAAFQLGKHVYLEKPIAPSLVEADEVVSAWRRAGTVGMIGFNYRFNPLHVAARRALREGEIGDPVAVRSVFSGMRLEVPVWKQSRDTGGGVLLDLASHHVDLVRFYFDEGIREVSASIRARRFPGDTATLELGLESGLRVQSFFSWSAAEADRFEIQGTTGRLVVDRLAGGVVYRVRRRRTPGWELSYPPAFAEFAAAIRGGRAACPDLADGRQALATILAAEESAATGRTVALPKAVDEHPAR